MKRTNKFDPKPLYRKINTTAHGVNSRVLCNSKNKYNRGTKEDLEKKRKMKTGKQYHGLDFSPLYGFLRKNVGKEWDLVKSQALKRLPKDSWHSPFYGIVIDYDTYMDEKELYDSYPAFCDSEASYHSMLYVDQNGILQYIDKNFTIENIVLNCDCCTHSFNGKPILKKKEK